MRNKVVVFDLDDTLYKEFEFLKSAYKEIAYSQEIKLGLDNLFDTMMMWYGCGYNVFDKLVQLYGSFVNKDELLTMYRLHFPSISLSNKVRKILCELLENNVSLGILTDGRSITQRNKINALHLMDFVSKESLIISEEFGLEKPSLPNYQYFEQIYPNADFVYVGDNINKDFIAPNQLGWNTVCLLDNGINIHKQNFSLPAIYLPKYKIDSFDNLLLLI